MARERRTSIRLGLEEAKQAEIAIGEAVITAKSVDDRRLLRALERKLEAAVWRLRALRDDGRPAVADAIVDGEHDAPAD